MKKHIFWLFNETELWVREGLVSAEQAKAIRARYPSAEQAGTWGRVVFAVAGAVLIGLGVILLFAYNWARIPKYSKLAVIFLSLLAAHAWAWYDKRPAIKETLHVLGTMLFGAGIWLVAQVYHMNEHYPTGILVWALGALSLAWALPSLAQALLAAFLLSLWQWFEAYQFHAVQPWTPLLILIGILPLAQVLASRVLAYAGLAALLFIIFTTIAKLSVILPTTLAVSASLLGAAMTLQRTGKSPELAGACFFYGNIFYFIMLFVLTFSHAYERVSLSFAEVDRLLIVLAYPVAAAGLWFAALWPFHDLRQRLEDGLRVDYLAVPLVFVLYALQAFSIIELPKVAVRTVYNIIILFSAVTLMFQGFRTLSLRVAVAGAALLSALAFARYTDLFHSLPARAAVFFLVGALMIGIGIFFNRARKTRQEARR